MDITVCISCIIKLFQVSDSNEATLAEAIEGYNSLYGHSKKLKVKMALSLPTPFRSFKHLGTKLPESRWLNYLPLIQSSRFMRIWIELLIQDLNRCLVGQWSLQFIILKKNLVSLVRVVCCNKVHCSIITCLIIVNLNIFFILSPSSRMAINQTWLNIPTNLSIQYI